MKSQLSQIASPSQHQRKSSMEETLQRLAVGVYGFIATEMLTDVHLMLSIIGKLVFIILTTISIVKMWRELK